jgi:sugar phosphate isomerase/epimerase
MFKNLSPEALGISGRDSEIIELALSHGFKGLDLDLVEFAEQVRTQGMARASRLIASARLKIGSFRLPVRLDGDASDYKADLERLPAIAEIAEQLGCTRTIVVLEPGCDSRPYHENFEFHRRRLAEIADMLLPRKIRLGVGFLAPVRCREGRAFQFIQTFEELLMLLRNIGPPNVGVAFDTWHWHLGGGKMDQLRALSADKIVSVSLADTTRSMDAQNADRQSRRLGIEGGAIDLPAVLVAMAELKYDGPVTPAPDSSQFAGAARDKIVKGAGAALDAIWKSAGLSPAGRLVGVTR